MPQSDKEITEILGIPRLTLHSWKIGNGYTRLLYSILKNMSVSELKEKRGMAEKVFNLLIISRDKLYGKLFAKLTEHISLKDKVCGKTGGLEYLHDIAIVGNDDTILIKRTEGMKSIEAHYILKTSHTKATFKKFIDKIYETLSTEFNLTYDQINLHVYGANSINRLPLATMMIQGKTPKVHTLNDILEISKEIVIMNHMDKEEEE